MEAGDYSDRCFYQTVLTTNNKVAEQAGSFVDYLDKTRVLSGEATKAAREQLGRDRQGQDETGHAQSVAHLAGRAGSAQFVGLCCRKRMWRTTGSERPG